MSRWINSNRYLYFREANMASESGGSDDFMPEDTYYRKISLHASKTNQNLKNHDHQFPNY